MDSLNVCMYVCMYVCTNNANQSTNVKHEQDVCTYHEDFQSVVVGDRYQSLDQRQRSPPAALRCHLGVGTGVRRGVNNCLEFVISTCIRQ